MGVNRFGHGLTLRIRRGFKPSPATGLLDVFLSLKIIYHSAKLKDFKWALLPIMLPAHNKVTLLWIMPMLSEIAAHIFKLNANALPPIPL